MAAVREEMSGSGCRVTLGLPTGSNTIGTGHSSHIALSARRELQPATYGL